MRVLHVLAPGEVGGLERVVQMLTTGLGARGHDMHVAAVVDRSYEHPLFGALRAGGVGVHPIAVPPRAYRLERAGIESLCRQIAPDVVHTHGYRADVVDAPVARGLGIPTISTVHGFTGGGWKNRAYELVQRMALRHFDLVIAVARPQAIELARFGVPTARVRVVPNAWCPDSAPLERFRARSALGVPRERFHLGWVGRLSWEKGADVFLDAVVRLRDLPIMVSVMGDGSERRVLEDKARRLGIRSLITWWGTLPSASRFFPGFDAFVISSRSEGTPIALFEAMRAGVPIVTTSVGGIPDVVSGDEAILVPPRDPAALAAGIRAVQQDPSASVIRAENARRRLTHYDAAAWLERHQALYQTLRQPSRLVPEGV
jgi:glycosyltransferase involved in cell wall biosynthesis